MAAPRLPTVASHATASPLRLLILFAVLLLTSLALLSVPLTFDSCWAALCDGDGDDEDDGPASDDEQAEVSSLRDGAFSNAVPLRPIQRHRLGRGLRLPGAGRRLGHAARPTPAPVVTRRTRSLPSSPGCEHSRRNGLGAPLRC